jgi:hypothetical protein
VFLAAAAAWPGGPAWAACGGLTLGAEAVTQASVWTERAPSGLRLVREHGRLAGATLSAAGACHPVGWGLSVTELRGTRAYDGVSSTGASLQTDSRIHEQTVALDLEWPVAAGASRSTWQVLVRGEHLQIGRDIASVGTVLGYPERFRFARASAGVRWRHTAWAGSSVEVAGWLGAGPSGRLDIALPIADATQLRTGSGRFGQIQFRWHWPSSMQEPVAGQWRMHVAASASQWRIGEGAEQALTRSGRLVGVARQPASRLDSHSISAGWSYAF